MFGALRSVPTANGSSSAGGHDTKGEVKVWDLASISDAGEHPGQVEKKRRQTIEFYEMLATAQPKVWEHRRNLGHAYARHGQWDKAINEYAKAVELYPAALGELAASLEEKGRHAEVVELLKKLAVTYPKRAYFPATAGRIYGDLGRWDEAIAWYRKAIEIDPKYVYAYSMLGSALFSQKKTDEAIACYRKAVELDPQSSLAWQQMGWVEYRTGNWRGSIKDLEKSCRLQAGDTGDCGQWIVMSLAHWKLANEKDLPEQERDRHKTEARRWYDQAVKQIGSRAWGENPFDQALQAFFAEAAELLGVEVKPK